MSNCPICGGKDTRPRFELYDDRYGYPGNFLLLSCRDCGHAFLNNSEFSDAEIQRLYTDYYPRRLMKTEDYRPHRKQVGVKAWLDGVRASAFRWVPPGVRILDIGSGFGQALGYHAARECEVWGVESDVNALRVAEHFGFNVRIGVFNPDDFPAEYFDVVTLDQVIEHVRDPITTLTGVRQVLKRGGIAIVATPNRHGWGARLFRRRWINWHAPYHIHFFSKRSMRMSAERAGLDYHFVGTITPSEWIRYQWNHLATRRGPGEASPFWSRSGKYSAPQRGILKVTSILHRSRINHLITRLFDGLNFGDSQLFILKRI